MAKMNITKVKNYNYHRKGRPRNFKEIKKTKEDIYETNRKNHHLEGERETVEFTEILYLLQHIHFETNKFLNFT